MAKANLPYTKIREAFQKAKDLNKELWDLYRICEKEMHASYNGWSYSSSKEFGIYAKDFKDTFNDRRFLLDGDFIKRAIISTICTKYCKKEHPEWYPSMYKDKLEEILSKSSLSEKEKQKWRERTEEIYNIELDIARSSNTFFALYEVCGKSDEMLEEMIAAPDEVSK